MKNLLIFLVITVIYLVQAKADVSSILGLRSDTIATPSNLMNPISLTNPNSIHYRDGKTVGDSQNPSLGVNYQCIQALQERFSLDFEQRVTLEVTLEVDRHIEKPRVTVGTKKMHFVHLNYRSFFSPSLDGRESTAPHLPDFTNQSLTKRQMTFNEDSQTYEVNKIVEFPVMHILNLMCGYNYGLDQIVVKIRTQHDGPMGIDWRWKDYYASVSIIDLLSEGRAVQESDWIQIEALLN